MIHDLKLEHEHFKAVKSGIKKFEIRRNDRGYSVGDKLVLHEIVYVGEEMNELEYTRRNITVEVKYMLSGPTYGLKEGWVIMSMEVQNENKDI
jgi:ASC-1-like (ASCH) protein